MAYPGIHSMEAKDMPSPSTCAYIGYSIFPYLTGLQFMTYDKKMTCNMKLKEKSFWMIFQITAMMTGAMKPQVQIQYRFGA